MSILLFVIRCDDKIIPVSELFVYTYTRNNGEEIHTLRARTPMDYVYIVYTGTREECEWLTSFIYDGYRTPSDVIINLTKSRAEEIISHYKKEKEIKESILNS